MISSRRELLEYGHDRCTMIAFAREITSFRISGPIISLQFAPNCQIGQNSPIMYGANDEHDDTCCENDDTRPRRPRASSSLIATLYEELHRLAEARLRRMRPGQTLQATDLVHEAYLKLERKRDRLWQTRSEFFRAAACAMRDVHVDYIRRRRAIRRGGNLIRTDMTKTLPAGDNKVTAETLYTMHEALERLKAEYPEHAEIILLQGYAGLTIDEISKLMDLSRRTVERRLRFARAWMQDFIADNTDVVAS